jgi:Fe-S-cluster containining protein
VTPDAPDDCLACGTCCFSTLPDYVRVYGSDYERLGERAADLTVFLGNRCFMAMTDGHCAALVVDPAAGRFVCAVYDARPALCRALERGSPACRAEVHEKGDRPQVALAALRARARARP